MTYTRIEKIKKMCAQKKIEVQINKNDKGDYSVTMNYKNSACAFFTNNFDMASGWIKQKL